MEDIKFGLDFRKCFSLELWFITISSNYVLQGTLQHGSREGGLAHMVKAKGTLGAGEGSCSREETCPCNGDSGGGGLASWTCVVHGAARGPCSSGEIHAACSSGGLHLTWSQGVHAALVSCSPGSITGAACGPSCSAVGHP